MTKCAYKDCPSEGTIDIAPDLQLTIGDMPRGNRADMAPADPEAALLYCREHAAFLTEPNLENPAVPESSWVRWWERWSS